jgi:hypothetical protein
MSYQGEEVVTPLDDGSGSVLVSDIWHVSGGQTVTQTLAAGTSPAASPTCPPTTDSQAPEGVLGVTTQLVGCSRRTTPWCTRERARRTPRGAGGGGQARGRQPGREVLAGRRDQAAARARGLRFRLARDQPGRVHQRPFRKQAHGGRAGRRPSDPQGPWTDPLSAPSCSRCVPRAGWSRPELPGGLSLFTGAQTHDEHRHRARPGLFRRPVGGLGVRATRQPGRQAGRLAEEPPSAAT